MKNLLPILAFLASTMVNGQTNDNALLQNMLTNILADSSFSYDLCTINGMPANLSYTYQSCGDQPLAVARTYITKEYTKADEQASIIISSFKMLRRSSSDLARLELLFPDGTRSSMRARRYARNGGRWFLTFYLLRGKNLETGAKVRILKGEI